MPQISRIRTGLSSQPWAVFVEYRTSPRPHLYSAQGIRQIGSAVPDHIRTAADYLNLLGIKTTDPHGVLKRMGLSREEMGELYLRLFINQVEALSVRAAELEVCDLLFLEPSKLSFISRSESLYLSSIQPIIHDGQELFVSVTPREPISELILEAFFSQPRDITRREKMIETLVQEANRARKSIHVAMYSFTNRKLAQALIAAKERGVDVRVILDASQAQKDNSQKKTLERAGIEVVLGDITMHHKSAVFDARVLIAGSFNWTSANENNYEDYLYLKGSHKVITQYQKRFDYLWEMFSLKLGTLVAIRNPALPGFRGFGHTAVPLSEVKRDELFMATASPEDHQKILDLFRTRRYSRHTKSGYHYRIARKELFSSLLKPLDPEFKWLRELIQEKVVGGLWPRFFYDAASSSGRYHKAHLNRTGGHFAHTREVILWTLALCERLGVSKEIKNRAVAAAALHDVYPGLRREKYAPRDHAELTADELERRFKNILESEDPHKEDLKEIIEAVRHHWDIWGRTPLAPTHSLTARILFWANYFASRPAIFIEDSMPTHDQVIDGLLERPLPNHFQAFAPLLAEDQDFSRLLRAVTGKTNVWALTASDKRLLAAAYALLPPALLSPEEASHRDELVARTILGKRNELRTALAASLILRHFERLGGEFKDCEWAAEALSLAREAHQTKANLTPAADRRVWSVFLANWLIQNRKIRTFTHAEVRAELARVATPRKKWRRGDYDRSALFKFTRDLQRFMAANLLDDFIPAVEEGFREKLNKGQPEGRKFKPISPLVMRWLVWRAKTLSSEKLYNTFCAPLKSKSPGEKRFLALLREESEENWSKAILENIRCQLEKKRIPNSKREGIVSALTRGVLQEEERSLGEIKVVLVNTGLRESEIGRVMGGLIDLRPREDQRSIGEIERALAEANVSRKTIDEIIRALGRIDLKESEAIVDKLDRILGEFQIGYAFRVSMVKDLREMIRTRTIEINRELKSIFEESGVLAGLPQGTPIPEFDFLARAWARRLADRGEALTAEPVGTLLRKTRSLDFKDGTPWQREMQLAGGILDQAVLDGERILVYSDSYLNGALATVISVQAVRHKVRQHFRGSEAPRDYEEPTDYELRAQRYAEEKVGYHVPEVAKEGFGLNLEVIRQKYEEGYRTILTANTGIKDQVVIEEARKLGMKVIILDSHPLPQPVPVSAAAVIHGSEKGVGGAVLAYKFAQALGAEPADFLDLATLGVLANIGEMSDGDRNVVYWGLQILNSLNRNIGIDALLEVKGMKGKGLDGPSVGFHLIPTFKTAGAGKEVVELLLSPDRVTALIQVEKLIKKEMEENKKREESLGRARRMIAEGAVLVSEWKPLEIMGVVAARLSQEYYSPIALINIGEESIVTGEVRSIPEINLEKILDKVNKENVFMEFGAHPRAAHFRMRKDKVTDFERLFKLAVEEEARGKKLVPTVPVVGDMPIELVTREMKTLLDVGLGPFKSEHDFGETDKPIFVLRGVALAGWRPSGKYRSHLLLEIEPQKGKPRTVFYRRSNTRRGKKALFENFGKERVDLAFSIGIREGAARVDVVDLK